MKYILRAALHELKTLAIAGAVLWALFYVVVFIIRWCGAYAPLAILAVGLVLLEAKLIFDRAQRLKKQEEK